MMSLIERAKARDADGLTTLTRTSKAHWGYSAEQMEEWKDDLMVSETYIEENEVYLKRYGDEVIGYYSYRSISETTIKLDNLFIAPKYMGKGIGQELINDFFNRVKQTKCNIVTLDADPHAETFYLKFGFRTIDQKETSIPGRFLPIMELELENT